MYANKSISDATISNLPERVVTHSSRQWRWGYRFLCTLCQGVSKDCELDSLAVRPPCLRIIQCILKTINDITSKFIFNLPISLAITDKSNRVGNGFATATWCMVLNSIQPQSALCFRKMVIILHSLSFTTKCSMGQPQKRFSFKYIGTLSRYLKLSKATSSSAPPKKKICLIFS